jgi:beta-lactamase class A
MITRNPLALHRNRALLLIAHFALLIAVGLFAFNRGVVAHDSCIGERSLLNPRFRCGRNAFIDKKAYEGLRSTLLAYIETKKQEGVADMVGVWFRDLEDGPTFGINEHQEFIPASLLKLPLALTYLQLSESDQSLMQREIVFNGLGVQVLSQTYLNVDPLKLGSTYSIQELLDRAIVHSDNVASQVLYDYLNATYGTELLTQTYSDLGILEMGSDTSMAAVNTKAYGSIFRMLYNSSYLNPDASEQLLSLLVQSDFAYGIRAGVPANMRVAEKFGERYLDDGQKQLHSCGIVYFPNNPYLLCVMTRGQSFDDLKTIISDISKKVYLEIDSRKLR